VTPIYDLHSHSIASDGILTSTELLNRAHTRGVTMLALTDHDTTAGVAEAQRQALHHGIDFIPGVEISTTWGGKTVHIVGLNVQPEAPALVACLARMCEVRRTRTEAIAAKLERAGIENALVSVYEQAGGASAVSRTHFARLIVQRGRARDMQQAFKKYLSNKGSAYVSVDWASLSEAVSSIRAAGGIAVVAHPGRYHYTGGGIRTFIDEFKTLGGQAIEVMSSSHSRDDVMRMLGLARDFDLYGSVGSDFHGPGNPQAELGAQSRLVDGCKPVWELLKTGQV